MPSPAWVALSLVEHLGGKKLRALLQHFENDLDAVLHADAQALRKVPGIGPKIAAGIGQIDLERTQAAMARWEAAGVLLLSWDDALYPRALLGLDDAPPTLFVRTAFAGGMVALAAQIAARRGVAVVGTRQPSRAAGEIASNMGYELARRGWVVVSGLAHGIDYRAHTGAIAAVDGITLAVLGGGVLNVYPSAHAQFAEAVMVRGALLGEVPPHAEPSPSNLVARNRLISGLCEALIVVESNQDSGALHAARRAREQGRRIYTLDLPAAGNRELIASGLAQVITAELAGF